MTLNIDFTPQVSARLFAVARQQGLEPAELVERLVAEHLPLETPLTVENDPTLALLESWIASAPTDPEEIREAEADLLKFQRNMNKWRKETGSRLLYPEVE